MASLESGLVSQIYDRPNSSYICNCKKYIINDLTFERQYAPYYEARLKTASVLLQREISKKWGQEISVKKLCDVTGSERCIVIGTIFKHMELHPSILKEICEEYNLIPQPITEEYTNEDDFLMLEDDLQRVVLCGNIDPQTHVTGINIAVLGYTEENGKFFVEDYCYSCVDEPDILPSLSTDKYVLLISGLGLGTEGSVLFPLQLLIDMITGQAGECQSQYKFSQLVRVVIAGNSFSKEGKDPLQSKFLTRKSRSIISDSTHLLDSLLSQLVASVAVDIMPGEFDPANHLLPQQPLHPCMFPKSSKYSTFNVVTNPYDATIDGVRFLGTSGQNVKNISAYSKITNPLDVLQKTLDWAHLAPIAPDSLNSYPYKDEDPFIISQYPHVYFCGNASKMEYKFYRNNSVLMVAIPEFQKTFSALMLNLRTLEVQPIAICKEVL
ncbi:DNA polymerase delta subunit 2-like [Argiope bruennichi]|uniref:DNA polymerase delta subunit 2-like n=1 Tax=Argiope bruennichi TaxID=94029 RepID=UPI0024954688|nr:DNA polymerase delta subunit 2-like [Argiope bruennichi]